MALLAISTCLSCGSKPSSSTPQKTTDRKKHSEVAIVESPPEVQHARSPQRRALVIGLGEQEDARWAKINGDKDVAYVKKMLRNAGYQDIRTLVNRQATKAGIVTAFHVLAENCQMGDQVYVHFSGHGQQVTDVNGDEGTDSLDEAWIPYDAYLMYSDSYKGEKHLVDDEVNELLAAVKTKIGDKGRLLVVVDACHSGDSSRGSDDEVVRGVGDIFSIPIKQRGKARKLQERWLTLSACEDFQVNSEMRRPVVGKLTFALYSLAGKGVSLQSVEDFMERYQGALPQTPVLTGTTREHTLSDFFKK